MPIGTCDPATRGEAFNVVELAAGENGNVVITIRFGWDGVSTRETGCDGPVEDIRVRNLSGITYWASLPRKRSGAKSIEIPAGTDTTVSNKGTLNSMGLKFYSDCLDVTITSTFPG